MIFFFSLIDLRYILHCISVSPLCLSESRKEWLWRHIKVQNRNKKSGQDDKSSSTFPRLTLTCLVGIYFDIHAQCISSFPISDISNFIQFACSSSGTHPVQSLQNCPIITYMCGVQHHWWCYLIVIRCNMISVLFDIFW